MIEALFNYYLEHQDELVKEYDIVPQGITPVMWDKRGFEIQEYMDKLTDDGYTIDSIVIIDDDSDMKHLSNFLVQTSFKKGFTYWDYRKALKKLRWSKYG